MKLRVEPEENSDIDMTPMIDIIFQLIIFFMIASSFVEQAKVYKVNLPRAENPATIPLEDTRTLTITADGAVAPGGTFKAEDRYKSLLEVVEDLKLYREKIEKTGKKPVLVIEADRDAKFERVIQVFNSARNAGIDSIGFQIEPGKLGKK